MQAADVRTVADLVVAETQRNELRGRNHTVLPVGQFRDFPIVHTMRLSFPGIVPGFLTRIARHRG
jgi:hypothetical protein